MAKKKICKYTEEKNRLHHILVMRSVEKTDKYDSEIKDLQAKVDLFEYGIL